MKRVYLCKICGWESSDFSDGRSVGNTSKALEELSEHFKKEHYDVIGEVDRPLRVILPNYVDVKVGIHKLDTTEELKRCDETDVRE